MYGLSGWTLHSSDLSAFHQMLYEKSDGSLHLVTSASGLEKARLRSGVSTLRA